MEDQQIVELFLQRDERAIEAAAERYAAYCASIIRPILPRPEDVEECLNDTWLRAWNAIPPHRPYHLALFLGKIARELAIDRYRTSQRKKRGGGEVPLVLEELEEVTSSTNKTPEEQLLAQELGTAISQFLRTEPITNSGLFIRRYYHLESYQQLAQDFGMTENNARQILFRMRKRLHTFLMKEGYL